jgi:hypothetical protein
MTQQVGRVTTLAYHLSAEHLLGLDLAMRTPWPSSAAQAGGDVATTQGGKGCLATSARGERHGATMRA